MDRASRTRTGDLLSAIQAAKPLKFGLFAAISSAERSPLTPPNYAEFAAFIWISSCERADVMNPPHL
jgi:hypothetical protein